jgi:hypothetical protein
MHYELLFPSLYLRSADLLQRDVTLTIRQVDIEALHMQGGKSARKPILYFVETEAKAKREGVEEKRVVLNKTNARTIADLYGNETDQWIGKRITLYAAKATFGRQTVDAIRVRERVPPQKAGKTTAEPEPATADQPMAGWDPTPDEDGVVGDGGRYDD